MRTLPMMLILLATLIFVGQGCDDFLQSSGNGEPYAGKYPSDEELSAQVETFSKSIGDTAENLSTNSFSSRGKIDPGTGYDSGQTCKKPVSATCTDGVKVSEYTGCQIGDSDYTAAGIVELSYSDNQCAFEAASQESHQEYSLTLAPDDRNFYLYLTTEKANNYRGVEVGGGVTTRILADGWEMENYGQHSLLYSRYGKALESSSTRTIPGNPIKLSGDLEELSFAVHSGAVEVSDNKREFTVTNTIEELTWNSSCCYPVSGIFSQQISGKYNVKTQAQFLSCGKVRVDIQGETRVLSLKACNQ